MGSVPSHWGWYFRAVFRIFSRKDWVLGQNQPFTSLGQSSRWAVMHSSLRRCPGGTLARNGPCNSFEDSLCPLLPLSVRLISPIHFCLPFSKFKPQWLCLLLWKWAQLVLSLSLSNEGTRSWELEALGKASWRRSWNLSHNSITNEPGHAGWVISPFWASTPSCLTTGD